jgi:hypothetical protein
VETSGKAGSDSVERQAVRRRNRAAVAAARNTDQLL